MDLFEKCRKFHDNAEYARSLGHPANPRMLEALGLYPYMIPIDRMGGTTACIDGRELIMIGSNNYLGMTTHPQVLHAAAEATRQFGTGCTGSRFLNGTLEMHLELESRLARFVRKEAALVFSTGYQTNLGVIPGLVTKGDLLVADREVHASIIDGMSLAKGLRGVEARFFRHNDPAALERILGAYPPEQGKLVIVDGVYSMSGEIARLPEIAAVCAAFDARLMVDDAHGIGVTGNGRGTAVELGCEDDVDLVMGTFSKSFASCGGYVAGPKEVIHWIQHYGRSFMFSASLPPANVATVLAVLDLIEEDPAPVERVNRIAARMRDALRNMGYDVGESRAAVVPVTIGSQFRAVQAWRRFFDAGIYTNAVLAPAVPAKRAALRTSYMATHTDAQLDTVLSAFQDLKASLARMAPRRVGRLRRAGRAARSEADNGV